MTVGRAQPARISRRAAEIRREREARRLQEQEPSPETGATLVEEPVYDDEARIAREDALSAMVPPGQMGRGAPPPDDGLAARYSEEIMEVGRETAAIVNNRLEQFREEIGIGGMGGTAMPKPFVLGSLYGAALFGLSLVASLALMRRRD